MSSLEGTCHWMPPNEEYHCQYIKIWQEIKKEWNLEIDQKEQEFLDKKNDECENS